MYRFRAFAVALVLVAAAGPAKPEVPPLPSVLQVLGTVSNAAKPVGNALVIALNLNSFDAIQTFSANDGTFVLPPLPAAVYKIIAVKSGFVPAFAMILPTQKDQRIVLRLTHEKLVAKGKDPNQEIWELRGSLPPDVLHELDSVLSEPVQMASAAGALPLGPVIDRAPRFKGEMMSLTGVADTTANPAISQTALGMESRFGDTWEIGFRGNLHRIDDPTDDHTYGEPLAESRIAQLEVRSSPTNAYRVATTNSSWRYTPQAVQGDTADIHAHNFEWEHGDARVQVRYLAQQNLFLATPGSEMVEIAGNTTVLQTAHSDVGVFIRVAQENVRNSASEIVRTADLTANASLEVVPSLVVHYGMASRLGIAGTSFAPRTGAEWKLAPDFALVVSGQYKLSDPTRRNSEVLPALVVWSDESRVLPRYSYSFGFISGDEKRDRFSAVATVTAIDAPMRLVFSDGFEQFWDGLSVDAGDLRRDLRVAYRRQLGNKIAVDLASSAGTASQTRLDLPAIEKTYISGDVASTFQPTGTTLVISYRHMRQPQPAGPEYSSDRVNVRFAQALHLPLDLKLLLGFEIAHAQNSPFLLDSFETDGATRRYIGGLAVNF